MEFTEKEKCLEAIKKEVYYNPDGFKDYTKCKDPELRKSVDDLYYGEFCVDNPKTIDDYIKEIAKENINEGVKKQEPIDLCNYPSSPEIIPLNLDFFKYCMNNNENKRIKL